MANSSKPKCKLFYFNIQGRAEPIRMALAAAGVDFEFEAVEREAVKSDPEHFPFAQVPRFVDDEVDMVQSMGILRHIGRKHGLYGRSRGEEARVEEVIEGVNDLVLRLFVDCVLKMKEDPAVKETYWQQHCDPSSASGPAVYGAHTAFLSRLLARSGSGFFVESGITVADIVVTTALLLHIPVFGRERLEKQWPDLIALHDRVLAEPKIAAYRGGPQCPPQLLMMM